MVSFIDGKVTTKDEDDHICGCSKQSVDFTDAWKDKVIADTGDKYIAFDSAQVQNIKYKVSTSLYIV